MDFADRYNLRPVFAQLLATETEAYCDGFKTGYQEAIKTYDADYCRQKHGSALTQSGGEARVQFVIRHLTYHYEALLFEPVVDASGVADYAYTAPNQQHRRSPEYQRGVVAGAKDAKQTCDQLLDRLNQQYPC